MEVSVLFSVSEGRDRICLALMASPSLIQSLFGDELVTCRDLSCLFVHSVSAASALPVAQEVWRQHLDFWQESQRLR